MSVASAAGYLALLEEPNPKVQANALSALSEMVNCNWHEIVEYQDRLAFLATNEKFPEHRLAALICAQVYFHLGDLDSAVNFALLAGDMFQVDKSDLFVEVVVAQAVERYISTRQAVYPQTTRFNESSDVSWSLKRLEDLFERLSARCLQREEYIQVIGVSIESRRLDILETAVRAPQSEDKRLSLVYYVVDIAFRLPVEFQAALLRFMVNLLTAFPSPDFVTIADCLLLLRDKAGLVSLLQKLLLQSEVSIALQICFNLNDNAIDPALRAAIREDLKGAQVPCDALSGHSANQLRLHLLSRSIASDLLILDRTRTLFNQGNSMFHSAVSLANGIMHAGTTNDDFIRKNMEWLAAASNWSKFTAMSALGSVYHGHREQSRHLLSQYLPKAGVASSEFSEGGALFALGLVHAGFPEDIWVTDYILDILKGSKAGSEVLQHGCCFGLGAAGLGSNRTELVEDVKAVLFSDNAVAGEGAAYALGLLMAGSGDQSLAEELLRFARETKHDKITRSLAVSIGLIFLGRGGAPDVLADSLLDDQDGWMRFGGVWLTALSHAGTGDRAAIRKLLRAAVTDASHDVRRVAVIGMSFVLIGRSSELPELVRLLLESYNPHLRFGALLALGIGFAGTGDKQVLEMIDGLTRSDKTDFVRQAAMLAAAMVLMQQSPETTSPLRQHLERVIGTKHEEALAKFGAVLSQGILDAGGRNACISLVCPNGTVDPLAVVGMAMFCQFWFWYPTVNFLSLALRPTALIAINATCHPPRMTVTCNAHPSLFAYPPPLAGEKETAPVKLVTAVLSTATGDTVSEGKREGDRETLTDKSTKEETKEMEADSFTVANFSRVTALQSRCLVFDGRYRPVSRFHPRCITVVLDKQPDQEADFIELVDPVAKQPSPVTQN